jgi:hypothetical protein
MNIRLTRKDRTEIKAKMTTVFDEKMKSLSARLQDILMDDLVTAFENRLDILQRTSRLQAVIEVEELEQFA